MVQESKLVLSFQEIILQHTTGKSRKQKQTQLDLDKKDEDKKEGPAVIVVAEKDEKFFCENIEEDGIIKPRIFYNGLV